MCATICTWEGFFLFYCGIDIAKNNHEASIIDTRGKSLLDSISFANTKEGCETLFALLERLNITKTDVIIGMEATGHYWLILRENRPYEATPPKRKQIGEQT